MEIIEIGAAWCTDTGAVIDRFSRVVKPTERPLLTPFATELTGITQTMVDAAPTLDTALYELDLWLAPTLAAFTTHWAAWGVSDQRQLQQETERKCLASTLLELPFANLKAAFARRRRVKQMGMRAALGVIGAPPPVTRHRALADALNICTLVPHTGLRFRR